MLATADRKTAEQCSEFIGHREVRQMDEAYAYGANSLRDATTLTPKKEIAPLVIPDDITNLPSLHGFIKFPDGFPAARVILQWRDYPEVARGFEPRLDVPQSLTPVDTDDDEDDEAGAREHVAGKEPIAKGNTPRKRTRAADKRAHGKDGKAIAEPLKPQALSAAELAAKALAADLGAQLGSASSDPAAIPGAAPAIEPSAQRETDDEEQRDSPDRPGKPDESPDAIRNEEHRQAIIRSALNTDFGVEDVSPAPDEGFEL